MVLQQHKLFSMKKTEAFFLAFLDANCRKIYIHILFDTYSSSTVQIQLIVQKILGFQM